ncbi:hypothetical protein Q3G72_021218 [Acer saccharum]|nr:hypothetical protein Q3G72_021218 [Acer saccharum]
MVGKSLLVEEETVSKKRLNRGRVLVLKDLWQEVPQLIKVKTEHGLFPVKLSEEHNPVDISWVNLHLGIINEDLNLNPPVGVVAADSMEDMVANSNKAKFQEKDKKKRDTSGQIRKVVREKSSSLDLLSNHRAWAGEEDREERGGNQLAYDIHREMVKKAPYCLKTPEKMKGCWAHSKVLPEGPTLECLIGQEEANEAEVQNLITSEDGSKNGHQNNSGQLVVYVQNSSFHPFEPTNGENSITRWRKVHPLLLVSQGSRIRQMEKTCTGREFLQADDGVSALKKRDSKAVKIHNMQTRNSKKGGNRKVEADGELIVNKVGKEKIDEKSS